MLTTTKRIIKSGLVSAWRQRFISVSSAVIMLITLLVLGSLIFGSEFYRATLSALENKVDVNVYFLPTAEETDILALKSKIEALPEVREVTYESREDALKNFELQHANDSTVTKALEEIGGNPLGAVLNISAKEVSQYESLARFLQSDSVLAKGGVNIIDNVNYFRNEVAIDRLTSIVDTSKQLGIALVVALALVSVLITYNTIRMSIYMSREEINVMRLVGASAFYVRGPFIVAGITYGFLAGLLATIIFFPLAYWLGTRGTSLFVNFNAYDFYISSLWWIVLALVGSGVVLGAISSILSVQKYLKK